MVAIEIETFRLADGTEEEQFLSTDAELQTDVAYQHPGLLRRTTARGTDGAWLVIWHWDSSEAAAAARVLRPATTTGARHLAMIDTSTVTVQHFQTV